MILVILLGFSAFFAACEAAFFSLSPGRQAQLKENHGRTGTLAYQLLQTPRELLITIYIGNELVNIAISALSTSIALIIFGNTGIAIAIGIGTFLILLIGEILPKSLALNYADRFALLAAWPLNFFSFIVQPIQKPLVKLAHIVLHLFGFRTRDDGNIISGDEFRAMVKLSEGEGIIDSEEGEMIHNVIEFGQKTVGEIMTPKIDMFTLNVEEKIDEILPKIIENFYSRVPVYDQDGETIIGLLLTKDLTHYRHLPEENFNLKNILKPVLNVPHSKALKDMLQDFKKHQRHMAVVFDEYGSLVGVVTLEDVLEELVGDIDSEMRIEETQIHKINEKRYRLNAMCSIKDFNEFFGSDVPDDQFNTIGGLVFGLFGRVPRSGETVTYDRFKYRVEKMKGSRILNLYMTLLPPKSKEEKTDETSKGIKEEAKPT